MYFGHNLHTDFFNVFVDRDRGFGLKAHLCGQKALAACELGRVVFFDVKFRFALVTVAAFAALQFGLYFGCHDVALYGVV